MRFLIIILCLFFTNYAISDADLLTVENIYSSAEDYNARKAKDKAFKDAIKRAAQIALEDEGGDSLNNSWKLSNFLVSYRVHDEKIEDLKYSAYFDFTFDLGLLKNLDKEKNAQKSKEQRIIFFDKSKNLLFQSWINQLAINMEIPIFAYEDVSEIYENDLLVIASFKDNGNFLISLEKNNKVFNITAASLVDSFIVSLQYAKYLAKDYDRGNANVIFFEAINKSDFTIDGLRQKIVGLTELNSMKIVSYKNGAIPKFVIDISEKDDLFLAYMYNSGDYQVNDLNLFEQVM